MLLLRQPPKQLITAQYSEIIIKVRKYYLHYQSGKGKVGWKKYQATFDPPCRTSFQINITFQMNYIDLPKEACFTPIYSPRSSLSKLNLEMEKLTTNLAINIDKYILGFFKDAFEQNGNQLSLNEFISQGIKHLKSWQRELQYREQKIYECLMRLFDEADNNHKGIITWSQFNSMLIEKGLNLKSLRNQQPGNTALMKYAPTTGFSVKHATPIEKMVCLGNKIGLFTEQSNQIDFFNLDGSASNLKPLILSQQSLTVQTSVFKRGKQGGKEIIKKDLVVAEYKNVVLDMIYINDSKYNMLITSSSDFMIKGWDVSSNIPVLAKQPENEDEKMQHQFQTEIHTMAWDNVNEVLYCCGKTPQIYEWMVKTDSERILFDEDGHTEMISAMIMMPKLQFLATGGYDGKLILWDTISQTKKFKYKEHTRSISSMAFHQNLILLFTAAYDHSICVWNPYIQSLIHKIISNVNFIQLDIIPETNLLIALDAESNVKIREINKFSLVSSFTIDKHEHKIEPSCMIATNTPLKYYFAGTSISVYEYIHIDANVILDSTALCLKYHAPTFSLYCPVKNHVVIWDLLTGSISNTLRNQATAEITAFDVFEDLKLSVMGDLQGNVFVRKLENGVLVKKLYKHKLNVTYILTDSSTQDKFIFSASYDGEIAVFERDQNGDFNVVRSVSIKKLSAAANVSALSYQAKRNTLIIGTQTGEVYFLDIDKNKMISRCETRAGDIEEFIQLQEDHILLAFSKKSEIFGLYLPPHLKKFKPSCHLVSQQAAKISSITMSQATKRCYIGFENGDLMCFWLSYEVISDARQEEPQSAPIHHIWKNNFSEAVRSLILVEKEQVLIAIVGACNLYVLACESGHQVAELNEKYSGYEPQPILYLDQDNGSIFIKEENLNIPSKISSKEDCIRRVFDPAFYLKVVESYQTKINSVSNQHWKFYPRVEGTVEKKISDNLQLYQNVREYEKQPKKLMLVRAQSQPTFDISRAVEIQKKWQKQKEEEDIGRTSKQQSLHNNSSLMRFSRFGSLNKTNHEHKASKVVESNFNKDNTTPLYRLGVALKNLNEKDGKALRLMEMAEKEYQKSKNKLKLPKLSLKTGQ